MIYLDYNATTPVADEVLDAMLPWFRVSYGNPSSAGHEPGLRAARAVDEARQKLGSLIHCSPGEIVFTSGATEANNLALKGLFGLASPERRRVLVGATEHKSVLEVSKALEEQGAGLDIIPVDGHGVVDMSALQDLLGPDVLVVSVMAANNETGTLNPIAEVAALAHASGAVFHTDATQWVGKIQIDIHDWDVDLLSLSAHKFYGPKGVGALFVRRRLQLAPVIHGGGQERGLRGGTLNAPGLVGLGAASELAAQCLDAQIGHLRDLRDRLQNRIQERLPNVRLNGHPEDRLPNTLNLGFAGAQADAVMARLPNVAVSSGSACTSAVPAPSHVLRAMGLTTEAAEESIRFSLGRETTAKDIAAATNLVASAVSEVRKLAEPLSRAEEAV
jgi:cysteine desulfurase